MSERPRRGDWQQSYTGRQMWPTDPKSHDFSIEDVAHQLALVNRFIGATFFPYSVAEHSVRASRYVEQRSAEKYPDLPHRFRVRMAFAALMHDAPEHVICDMPRPLKQDGRLYGYRAIEERLAETMEAWCGLPLGAFDWPIVKEADHALLITEKRDHLGPAPAPWGFAQGGSAVPLPRNIGLWHFRNTAKWARDRLVEAVEVAVNEGPGMGVGFALAAAREFADSGPWPWWLAERRFLARWAELTAHHGVFKPEKTHYHSCPECYERFPCVDSCTAEVDLSENGVTFGSHAVCDDCKADGRGDDQ